MDRTRAERDGSRTVALLVLAHSSFAGPCEALQGRWSQSMTSDFADPAALRKPARSCCSSICMPVTIGQDQRTYPMVPARTDW
jgi:hypothetical protein